MEKKSIINVDGRLYYGWVMLICGFMTMFICYVIKANCTSLFYTPICEELGVTRTVYTQTNTVLTICMLIGSDVYKRQEQDSIPVHVFADAFCVGSACKDTQHGCAHGGHSSGKPFCYIK